MLLHHFGDGAGHGLLLRRQALVEARAQPFIQEVDDEFRPTHLLSVVLNPRHLSLRRKLPIKVVLREREKNSGGAGGGSRVRGFRKGRGKREDNHDKGEDGEKNAKDRNWLVWGYQVN